MKKQNKTRIVGFQTRVAQTNPCTLNFKDDPNCHKSGKTGPTVPSTVHRNSEDRSKTNCHNLQSLTEAAQIQA